MTRVAVLPDLDPARYERHLLHAEDRVWVEKNCYIDVWIEVVHALGLDPMAMLPFVIAVDFVGGQWTFYKPSHGEIYDLYGLEVNELNVWRPLVEHAQDLLAEKVLIATESDSFYLPDTSGTDYKRNHVKTTIILNDLDVEARRLGYWHNAAYHYMEGDDFIQTFKIGMEREATFLPLFAETIRTARMVKRTRAELVTEARRLLKRHVARAPKDNPMARFAEHFTRELPAIQAKGLNHYHAWAFGTVRQLGSAAELASLHLRWHEDAALAPAAEAFDRVSQGMKTFILKAARAVNSKKPMDVSAQFAELAAAWQRGLEIISVNVGA
jgi:hypothetical protein